VSDMGTVLVVDDDLDLREIVADVLTHAGYETLCAEHGSAALEVLRREDAPDVILLDMMMPVMNGLSFAKEMRKDARIADIPIVTFSAQADHERAAQTIRAAASLKKPVKMKELLSVLGDVIRRSAAPPTEADS
jgi:CheY-like chemotaxis protein